MKIEKQKKPTTSDYIHAGEAIRASLIHFESTGEIGEIPNYYVEVFVDSLLEIGEPIWKSINPNRVDGLRILLADIDSSRYALSKKSGPGSCIWAVAHDLKSETQALIFDWIQNLQEKFSAVLRKTLRAQLTTD